MRDDQSRSNASRAAERCDDLTPLVYRRLFSAHPELEAVFVMDRTGAARGSMLAWVIKALLDFVGERQYGRNLIQAEAVNHVGLGVAPQQFRIFFGTLAQTLQEVLGPDWSAEMDAAWQHLLAELDECMSEAQA